MTDQRAGDPQGIHQTVARNTLVSMLSTIIYLVTRVLVPPVTLHYLGVETWGIWSFCFVITGYLGMGAFGISNVYIRYSAIFKAQNDAPAINCLVSTGLSLTIPFSLVVMGLLYLVMPSLIAYFNISPSNRDMAFMLFTTTVATFLLQLTLSAFDSVLVGLQQIAASRQAQIAATLTETFLIIAGMVAGLGVYALMLAFVVRNLLSVTLTLALVRRFLPEFRLGPSLIDRAYYRHFWSYGGALQFNGLLSMLAGTLDRILFLKFFGEKAAGLLDIGQKFPRMAVFIPETISGVIYPAVAHLQQGEHHAEIEQLYIRGCRYINLIMASLVGFMAPFSIQIMAVWMGVDTDLGMAPFLMLIFCLPFHAHVFTGPASAVFKGLGQPLLETHYPVYKIAAIAALVALVALIQGIEMRALALATAGGALLSAMAYVAFANLRLRIRLGPFFRAALLPGLLPYALGFALEALTAPWLAQSPASRWSLALAMLPTGLAYLGLLAIVDWFLLNSGERDQLKQWLAKLQARLPARFRHK